MISVAFRLSSSLQIILFFLEQESFNVYIMEMFHSSAVDDITIISKINFLYLKEKIRTNEFTACIPPGKSGNKKYIA